MTKKINLAYNLRALQSKDVLFLILLEIYIILFLVTVFGDSQPFKLLNKLLLELELSFKFHLTGGAQVENQCKEPFRPCMSL